MKRLTCLRAIMVLAIIFAADEAVVPVRFDPAAKAHLQDAEVDDPAHGVQLVGLGVKKHDIVVAVEMRAVPLVFHQTMPGAKGDPANGGRHGGRYSLSPRSAAAVIRMPPRGLNVPVTRSQRGRIC